jgi:glutamyl-tRNA synthetase
MPLFTITSVVDDIELNVSNILRGDDHITNTAAQIKLFKYLGSEIPKFGHFPLMRTKTGSGLSKRFNSFSLKNLKSRKIFPLIIMNYLNKIGSSSSLDEIDNIEKLIQLFDISLFSKNSVLFNESDLERLNAKYLKELPFQKLKNTFDVKYDENFWNIVKGNVDQLSEIDEWFNIIKSNHEQKINVDSGLKKIMKDSLPDKIDKDSWSLWTKKILSLTEIKPKDLFMKLRLILTGRKFGPSMNEILTLFSREEILRRLEANCE